MPSNLELENVIEDAVNDAHTPQEPVEATPEVEATEDPVETPVEATGEPSDETSDPAATSDGVTVKSPAEASETPAQDEFAKRFGIPQVGATGRENRIPYSRVKKITEKAATEATSEIAEAVLGRKLNPGEKALDVVKQHVAQLPELTTKVTDYESRLERVGQFEEVMANDPDRFLPMLAQLPAYADFFAFVNRAIEAQNAGQPLQSNGAAQNQLATELTGDGMPDPDQELEDGSKVYSMDGLKKLLAWNANQTEQRVVKQLEQRYKPIESEWQYQQQMKSVLPGIRAQIEEAKTWPLFNESEEEITQVLAADPKISLERAYQKVVFPKMQAERARMRQEILQEVKQAPRSTAVSTPSRSSVTTTATSGPRKLEDIIAEQVKTLK
jgi:hypothetical protein